MAEIQIDADREKALKEIEKVKSQIKEMREKAKTLKANIKKVSSKKNDEISRVVPQLEKVLNNSDLEGYQDKRNALYRLASKYTRMIKGKNAEDSEDEEKESDDDEE